MLRSAMTSLLLACVACTACSAIPGAYRPGGTDLAAPPTAWVQDEDSGPGPVGTGWTILMYVPNRLLDLLDIVRARLRFGPGIAVGVRASEQADFFLGTYTTVYIGLPGPRGRRLPRLPAGLESRTGIEAGPVDISLEAGTGPDYGESEVGLGFQIALFGLDLGVDPLEALDFVAGLITLDPADDDF